MVRPVNCKRMLVYVVQVVNRAFYSLHVSVSNYIVSVQVHAGEGIGSHGSK
jgi:hypothetical protein